jgi:hypothetical protein
MWHKGGIRNAHEIFVQKHIVLQKARKVRRYKHNIQWSSEIMFWTELAEGEPQV